MTFFALRAFCSLWARIAVGVGWSILPKNGVGSIRKRRSGIALGRPLRSILPTFLVQCSSSSGGSRAIGFMRQSRLVTEVEMHSWHNARLAMLLLANASSTWIALMSIAKRKLRLCARSTAKSSSSASERAGLRLATDATSRRTRAARPDTVPAFYFLINREQ